jgi:hypothetical protein
MKIQNVCEYRVKVDLDGENKIFDVRNSSVEQCTKDVKQAFDQFNPKKIEVKPIASLEFKRK